MRLAELGPDAYDAVVAALFSGPAATASKLEDPFVELLCVIPEATVGGEEDCEETPVERSPAAVDKALRKWAALARSINSRKRSAFYDSAAQIAYRYRNLCPGLDGVSRSALPVLLDDLRAPVPRLASIPLVPAFGTDSPEARHALAALFSRHLAAPGAGSRLARG